MDDNRIAKASTTVNTTIDKAWDALITPAAVKQYMFGTTIASDWHKGSAITWKGDWKGKPYEDKGVILDIEPTRLLRYTHFSPLAGLPNRPENYHTVSYAVTGDDDQSTLTITQENNRDQAEVDESQKTWTTILEGLKKVVEDSPR